MWCMSRDDKSSIIRVAVDGRGGDSLDNVVDVCRKKVVERVLPCGIPWVMVCG